MLITITQTSLGILLILQGLFLWFALAFNGSVGETFVNYSFFTSALFMLITGGLKIANSNWQKIAIFGGLSIVLYLPMIWQRFQFRSGTDSPGLYFDCGVILVLVFSILFKPNKFRQRTQKA